MPIFTKYDFTIDQDHGDLKILAEELTNKKLRFRTHFKSIDGVTYEDSAIPQLRRSFCGGIEDEDGNKVAKEGHYINLSHITYWNDDERKALKEAMEAANKRTDIYIFELYNTSDLEYDDDRTWDAHFTFHAIKNEELPF